jgi:DNA-binding transcriptional MerR regulator
MRTSAPPDSPTCERRSPLDDRRAAAEGGQVRIGELARELGVSADTLRFYERSGLLPRPRRAENGYRDYGPVEVERIRLMLDLRRLDIGLTDAARMASWCQSGHCADTSTALPQLLTTRRAALRERIRGLEELDRRLRALESHLSLVDLPMAGDVGGPCCGAAAMVLAADDPPPTTV